MKYKKLNYLTLFIYLISFGTSYSIDPPDTKNLIIHDQKIKIEKIEFFNSKNKKITLNDYRSNLVIINFWATWCAPCKDEMPSLDKLHAKNGVFVFPINMEEKNLNNTDKFYNNMISFPFHVWMSEKNFDYMIDSVKKTLSYFRKYR